MLAQPAVPHPSSEFSFNAHISSPAAVQLAPKRERTRLPTFTVRRATIQDAAAIASLGAHVFSTSFGFSIPTPDLNAYLDEAYSISAIEEDIRSRSKHLVVACSSSDGRVMGFAQLTEGTTEPCIEDLDNVVELQRLYVDRDFHGSGVGKALTREIERLAREKGYRIMWLGVWEGNFKAQRVYEAMGFLRVGDHEFKMGRCIQTDWIMCKDL
ncbi:uncharacterized protein Z518_00917 [Rhinocladiella mackenziei CBS 650.93]|uniref:N-acetyltransferase domain-containing protein n=1 Tax=Rhinocladiella mackenziei CBS 650.93 TaxID=1442369 RepID=A0A0D2J298_9EURO|nr:uncharacterized protein Z518_00917 [Rhinocladiella mackenziei CBS 650.93]KIX09836.1 hypothetical protein Z518_00917 [Rhinocladiella mackenziei CBS 650.93]